VIGYKYLNLGRITNYISKQYTYTHLHTFLDTTCLQKLMILSMYAIDCILEKILTQHNVSQISASCNELLKDFCTDCANRALSILQNFGMKNT
jgi:hypothetical protein